jgi:glycosyltransferase involved in cell wall biosynthesis
MENQLPARELTVSVIMPAYRAAKTICRAIDSILAQTYPVDEILVIDDESPEDLAEVLRGYGDRVRLFRQPRGGAAAARNRGIDISSGDLVTFLDSDDQWLPETVALGVEVFRKCPDVGLVVGRYILQNSSTGEVQGTAGPQLAWCGRRLNVERPRLLEYARATSTGSLIIRRSLLGQNRFDETLTTAEDRDLWLRLLAGGTVFFLSNTLNRVFLRDDSLSHKNLDVDCRCMMRVIERYSDLLGAANCRREKSYVHFRWALGLPGGWSALVHWAQSVRLWPLPYRRGQVRYRMARLRALVAIVRRWGRSA